MSPFVRQTCFSAGELAPELWGRTDLGIYAKGARRLLNFFVSKQGAAISRPGTKYVATVKTPVGPSSSNFNRVRLLPFVYSDYESYALEFGHGYIRFHRNGAPVTGTVLPYDTQTVNFTVGQTLTGLTSGATARITGDTDAGASGTLQLDTVVGTFVDNEVLRESFDGEFLRFDTQTANFALGLTVTGGTSGATGKIVDQLDAGATGFLRLVAVTGTFSNNEIITDSATGSATVNLERALVNGAPSSVAYELVAPYSWDDLPELQWAQTGDIVTITHPGYAPMELRRYGQTYWSFVAVGFEQPTPYFTNLATGAPVFGPVARGALPTEVVADGHTAREWVWKATAVVQEVATGQVFETLAATVIQQENGGAFSAMPATIPVYPEKPVTVGFVTVTSVIPPANWRGYRTLAYNWYRGSGTLFGFVGQSQTLSFVDLGAAPDYAIQPPQGTNPFKVYTQAGVLTRTEHPAAVAFFQEKRVFGGSWSGGLAYRPETLFFSATGDYFNFDQRFASHVASEALVYALAARRREEIRSLFPGSHLLVFTNASIWAFGGAGGGPLGPDSVDARMVEEVGATHQQPIDIGGLVLYVRTKGSGIRGIAFQNERGGFAGVDVSAHSRHLFARSTDVAGGAPNQVEDWCYAEDPWGLVWVVRTDGSLLSLTRSQDEQALAWARHAFPGGAVEGVCSVPEGEEDAVYLVVRRSINGSTQRYVERMTSRVQSDTTEDDVCIDSATTYSGAVTTALSGLAHLEGQTVYVVGKGNPVQGPYVVTAGAITLGELPIANSGGNAVLHIGLKFTCDFETLDLAQADVRTRQKAVKEVVVEVSSSRGLKAGPSFDKLTPWRQRTVGDSFDAIANATDVVRVPVRNGYSLAGRACIRQDNPLPLTIVGVTREVDLGGS